MMIQSGSSGKTYDTAIIGGGVLGLWAARHAIKRGEKVVLVEKRHIGAGASGGFLGALMPHMPDNWNAKKQFQYDGLSSIENAIAALKDDTGVDCGFHRCGRFMPLTHEKILPQIERRLEGASMHWGEGFEMTLNNCSGEIDRFGEWLISEIAAHGIQYDTLSARVNPRAYLAALEEFVRPRAEMLEGVEAIGINAPKGNRAGEIVLANDDKISSGRIIVANGWEAYPLLQPSMGGLNQGKSIGRGVKGQAVLVEFEHGDDLPIVYHDGAYVVPHAGNRVAIGSTSLNEWQGQPDEFDPDDMTFYEKAIALVPVLKNAPSVDRWAGVRPRNTIDGRGTSPWFGPVPDHENLIALIGGFKITLGVAHLDVTVDAGFMC
ncbi:MAG: FAD-binding oxidoreductase [Pseudomonadota bacterium]